MTYYIKRGSKFSITNKEDIDIRETLPVGTYTVGYDMMSAQFFLETIDSFEKPKKIYGTAEQYVDRFMTTFLSRKHGTGILLSGEKGSGKTLTAKLVSIAGLAKGIPTIVINQAWAGEEFNRFIQTMEQPIIVLFDEFEKVYDEEKQSSILTLLDGTYPSKKMYLMTCNDRWVLSRYMFNRPGRFFYSVEYKGLEEIFIREYCEDKLLDQSQLESIVRYSKTFSAFNFDMLQALVEEMNRYEEKVQEALKYLNISSDQETARYDVVELYVDGVKIAPEDFNAKVSNGNSIALSNYVYAAYKKKVVEKVGEPIITSDMKEDADAWAEDDEDEEWTTVSFVFSHMKAFTGDTVTYVDAENNNKLVMAKAKAPKYDPNDFLF